MYLYTAHLNKKSQVAESHQNKNVFRSGLNSHMSVEVQQADYSTAEVQQPRNFYHLALSVSEGLRKCESPLTGGADVPDP